MPEVPIPLINSVIIAILGGALTFITTKFFVTRKERVALMARITELERKASATDFLVAPVAAAMQAILVKTLTHDHAPELDALLAKLSPYSLTPEEAERIVVLLEERETELVNEEERDAAHILPAVIRMMVRISEYGKEVGANHNS